MNVERRDDDDDGREDEDRVEAHQHEGDYEAAAVTRRAENARDSETNHCQFSCKESGNLPHEEKVEGADLLEPVQPERVDAVADVVRERGEDEHDQADHDVAFREALKRVGISDALMGSNHGASFLLCKFPLQ